VIYPIITEKSIEIFVFDVLFKHMIDVVVFHPNIPTNFSNR